VWCWIEDDPSGGDIASLLLDRVRSARAALVDVDRVMSETSLGSLADGMKAARSLEDILASIDPEELRATFRCIEGLASRLGTFGKAVAVLRLIATPAPRRPL